MNSPHTLMEIAADVHISRARSRLRRFVLWVFMVCFSLLLMALGWFVLPPLMPWRQEANQSMAPEYLGTLSQVHFLSDWVLLTQIDLLQEQGIPAQGQQGAGKQASLLVHGIVVVPLGTALQREPRRWNSDQVCVVRATADAPARCWTLVGVQP